MFCEAWMEIGQDPICGAKQKGGAYWKRIAHFFHEQRKFEPHIFDSDRIEVSLQKRWRLSKQTVTSFVVRMITLRYMVYFPSPLSI